MDSVEPSDIYGRSQSPPPHLAPTPAPLPLVSSSVLYPKTYGDLLVYQRDVKLKKLADVAVAAAAAVVTQQQNRKINEQADNSGQPQLNDETDKMKESQLTIKTTERYYPHFFANGRRGVPTSPLFLWPLSSRSIDAADGDREDSGSEDTESSTLTDDERSGTESENLDSKELTFASDELISAPAFLPSSFLSLTDTEDSKQKWVFLSRSTDFSF
jgi:hypothetical protein